MAGEEDVMVGQYLSKLNGKPNAGGKRLALHLPFGSNCITQILEVHKTKTASESINNRGRTAEAGGVNILPVSFHGQAVNGPKF